MYLSESGAAQTAAVVRLQDAHLDEADHGRLLNTGVRLLAAVGHKLAEQHALLDERVLLLEPLEGLGARRQHRHQHALAGRRLYKSGGWSVTDQSITPSIAFCSATSCGSVLPILLTKFDFFS